MRATCIVLLLLVSSTPALAQTQLHIASGVDSAGRATEQWQAILQKRLDEAERARVPVTRLLSPDERAWDLLIRERATQWGSMAQSIAELYDPALPPLSVVVVNGNRGAADAFVHDSQTIGFDLSALQAQYGSARLPENADRIDRLFRHEYAHLMQKAWLAIQSYAPESPVQHALLDIWLEGLGTYHSVSQPWRATRAGHSSRAQEALRVLEPRFLVRLAALACSEQNGAARLTADLSQGPFKAKWGALTAGLWIEREAAEASRPEIALQSIIEAGPDGIWELATRQLDPRLRSLLSEIRDAEQLCEA